VVKVAHLGSHGERSVGLPTARAHGVIGERQTSFRTIFPVVQLLGVRLRQSMANDIGADEKCLNIVT
jgi:hypothetical protein